MDAGTFASQIRTAGFLSFLPGNCFGETRLPVFDNPDKDRAAGEGVRENYSWTSYLSNVKELALAPAKLAHDAFVEVRQAGGRAGKMVLAAEDRVLGAVTGITGFVKWLIIGLVALAVIYALAVLSPVLRGAK